MEYQFMSVTRKLILLSISYYLLLFLAAFLPVASNMMTIMFNGKSAFYTPVNQGKIFFASLT